MPKAKRQRLPHPDGDEVRVGTTPVYIGVDEYHDTQYNTHFDWYVQIRSRHIPDWVEVPYRPRAPAAISGHATTLPRAQAASIRAADKLIKHYKKFMERQAAQRTKQCAKMIAKIAKDAAAVAKL